MCVSHEQIIIQKVRIQDNICKLYKNATKKYNEITDFTIWESLYQSFDMEKKDLFFIENNCVFFILEQ